MYASSLKIQTIKHSNKPCFLNTHKQKINDETTKTYLKNLRQHAHLSSVQIKTRTHLNGKTVFKAITHLIGIC